MPLLAERGSSQTLVVRLRSRGDDPHRNLSASIGSNGLESRRQVFCSAEPQFLEYRFLIAKLKEGEADQS